MDTLGNLIDKLQTVSLKKTYLNGDKNKSDNLKTQSYRLISEIDDMFLRIKLKDIDADDMMRPQHKTY